MEIAFNDEELARYMREAVSVSNESPVLLTGFGRRHRDGRDAICDGKRVLIGGLMQHIEQAGVHSGDSACSIPPYELMPSFGGCGNRSASLLRRSAW